MPKSSASRLSVGFSNDSTLGQKRADFLNALQEVQNSAGGFAVAVVSRRSCARRPKGFRRPALATVIETKLTSRTPKQSREVQQRQSGNVRLTVSSSESPKVTLSDLFFDDGAERHLCGDCEYGAIIHAFVLDDEYGHCILCIRTAEPTFTFNGYGQRTGEGHNRQTLVPDHTGSRTG